MSKRFLSMCIVALLVVTGCATYSSWTPTVDTYGYDDRDYRDLSRDEAQCKDLAYRASGGAAEETVKGAAVGGLIGAAAGAAIGAAAGNPGKGAAIGAAAGGIGGGAKLGIEADQRYKDAYVSCMRERGHKVVY
jgi:outer membrane lipoprotein SlyB